jgi:hypothetical protein
MHPFNLLIIATILSGVTYAETFGDVDYFYKPNGKDKAEAIGGKLALDNGLVKFDSKKTSVTIPAASITNVVYERSAKPRYAAGLLLAWPLLFTNSKQHYLTFEYTEGTAGKYALFKLDKGNYREILASTEAATGKKIQRVEEK